MNWVKKKINIKIFKSENLSYHFLVDVNVFIQMMKKEKNLVITPKNTEYSVEDSSSWKESISAGDKTKTSSFIRKWIFWRSFLLDFDLISTLKRMKSEENFISLFHHKMNCFFCFSPKDFSE
jgi:hypothetical protein